jgi:glycine oxidase
MTPDSRSSTPDVLVVGGGVIGLAVAWRLARRGHSVQVLERETEPSPQRTAALASGGMLAAAAEMQFEEPDLYAFSRESLRRWPGFARDLEADAGTSVGYRDEGTLIVAVDRDDAEALRRVYRFQREEGAPVSWLAPAEALDLEPFLSPKIAGAVHSPEDHQVDNRALMAALWQALPPCALRAGVEVATIEPDAERPAVRTASGERIEARVIVLAAGAWVRQITGLPTPLPIRPVKGQLLALEMVPPFELRHVVRGPRGYLVPKADGRLAVGATAEEMGFDTRVTGGGVYRLLDAAVEMVPGVEELPLVATFAGLRPAARDHLPVLGFGAAPGVALAVGHYRHGVLQAPITADEVAKVVATRLAGRDETSDWLTPFSPVRFDHATP